MNKTFLKGALKNKNLIGIRTVEHDLDETTIGFLISVDDNCFTINEIDPFGFFIGLTTILFDDVINIDINDRYLRRLHFIFENKNLFDRNKKISIFKKGYELVPYFDFLIKNNLITTFYFNEDNYLIGILLEYDNCLMKVKCIGNEGDEDGESIYQIEKLSCLRYNGIEEQKIQLLFENRDIFY